MQTIKAILDFLSELESHNQREWFQEHKGAFEEIKASFEHMTQSLIDLLQLEDESFSGLQAKDCIFRIYRDLRFSKDTAPYKTHLGAYLAPGGRKSELCGYYLQLKPHGQSLIAGGLFAPSPAVLYEVRDAIYAAPEDFKAIISAPAFVKTFGSIEGEKLKRAPKGFPKSFEAVDLLKHKSFIARRTLSDAQVSSENFTTLALNTFRKLRPFNDFFNKAIRHMEG